MPVIATTRLWTAEECTAYLRGLVELNLVQMKNGLIPRENLYHSHVRYQAEPLGSEVWQSGRELYASGIADCEDLVALRTAEYLWKGVRAQQLVKDVRPGLRHCLVLLPGGQLEDPSRARGMGGVPVSTVPVIVTSRYT